MNKQRQTSKESLPEELISQILLKLPVRSVVRFKSVCKCWHSLISDPEFGKSHFDLAATAPAHRCLTKANDSEIESIDVDASLYSYEFCVVNLKFPLPPPRKEYSVFGPDPPSDVEFIGSCRGFVLVAYPQGDVIVWNPSTGFRRRIADDLEEMIALYPTGFGYDRSTDDYLLVLMNVIPLAILEAEQDRDSVANDYPTSIRMFSTKTNSWFDMEGSYTQYVDKGCYDMKIGSFLSDALHWLVTSYETKLHVIIAFDLVERSLSEIHLSQTLARKLESKPYEYYLRVLGECLSLCYPGDADSMAEIWMMKDYTVQSSWTKLFVFSTCNIPRNVIYPICFTKRGDLFCSYGSGRLVKLNDKGWLLLDQRTKWPKPHMMFGRKRDSILHCGLYRESLLSLPNVFKETREDDPPAISLEETSEDNQ